MNSCNFTGRITNDLELKTTQNGLSICSFSLAVKRPRAKDTTDFIRFTAFRQSAEYLCSYARKGALVEVSGALTSRNWEDNNGKKQTSFEIVVDNVSILESKNASNVTEKVDSFAEVEEDGDLPF